MGRGIATDAITTPVVNTSAYFFKKTQELIDFKVLSEIDTLEAPCSMNETTCISWLHTYNDALTDMDIIM